MIIEQPDRYELRIDNESFCSMYLMETIKKSFDLEPLKDNAEK